MMRHNAIGKLQLHHAGEIGIVPVSPDQYRLSLNNIKPQSRALIEKSKLGEIIAVIGKHLVYHVQ